MAITVDTTVSREAALGELMASGELPAPREPGQRAVHPTVAARVQRLSVVIPAKNEAAGLGELLTDLGETLRGVDGLAFEVLLINDGSSDETAEIAARHGAIVISHPQSLGNGAAVKRGIREARGDWVLLLDGDGQHPPAVIPDLLEAAAKHDMVVASRGGGGGDWHRNLANRCYNRLASYVTNRPIPDLTSGFRLVRADLAKGHAYLLPNTFSYPTTITLALMRGGYSVGFEPFAVRRREGKSHIRILRDGSRFFLIILRIATFFAPLRVFVPLSVAMGAAAILWYAFTFLTTGRLTNMTVVLLTQATVVFVLGLISEQVNALRFDRSERS